MRYADLDPILLDLAREGRTRISEDLMETGKHKNDRMRILCATLLHPIHISCSYKFMPAQDLSTTKPRRGQGQALVSILEIETTWPIDAAFLCNRSHKKGRISYIRNGQLPYS